MSSTYWSHIYCHFVLRMLLLNTRADDCSRDTSDAAEDRMLKVTQDRLSFSKLPPGSSAVQSAHILEACWPRTHPKKAKAAVGEAALSLGNWTQRKSFQTRKLLLKWPAFSQAMEAVSLATNERGVVRRSDFARFQLVENVCVVSFGKLLWGNSWWAIAPAAQSRIRKRRGIKSWDGSHHPRKMTF